MYKGRKEAKRRGWKKERAGCYGGEGKGEKGGREWKKEKRDGGMETRRGLARMRVGEKIELACCHF